MSQVLIDSSVWISFFKGDPNSKPLLELIDSNRICVNDLILAELIPALLHKKENHLVEVIEQIECIPIEIDWNWIIETQKKNLANGLNKVGIPDLIIALNAVSNDLPLFSFDKHFRLMAQRIGLKLFELKPFHPI